MKKHIIIFDGDCGFCNKTIMFIAKNDKNNNFNFISSLSAFGIKVLLKNSIKSLEKSTMILIENSNIIHTKSIAISKIILLLPNYKFLGKLMLLFPKIISDWIYDYISRNRKKIGYNGICEIPNAEIRKKIIA